MGQEIERDSFTEDEYRRFSQLLRRDLRALGMLLGRPGFGAERPGSGLSMGVELELNLVDAAGQPLPRNQVIMDEVGDPRVKLELDRFNLEVNGSPRPLAGQPFTAMGDELLQLIAKLGAAAGRHGGRIAPIGILPTLRAAQLRTEALTDAARYRAMARRLHELRGGPFRLAIEGDEPLALDWYELTLEGATTSLQVHLRTTPAEFADTYNAAQLATGPVLACAVNSPLFLEHRLWQETRIALFRQSVDDRDASGALDEADWRPARVSFGHGWVRRGAWELFAESVALHPPLLPVLGEEADPEEVVARGGIPELCALRLHHGTTWRWNRAIYDPGDGGHLRVELRALPAGPTTLDMAANAAFALGLTLALRPRAEALVTAMTFGQARRNFYAAARSGLEAELLWPRDDGSPAEPVQAVELIARLLPQAKAGLRMAGVDEREANAMLSIIAERTSSGQTGAAWQRKALAAMERTLPRRQALAAMLEAYLRNVTTGRPVHTWRIPSAPSPDAGPLRPPSDELPPSAANIFLPAGGEAPSGKGDAT